MTITSFKSTVRATGALLAALLLVVVGCGNTRPCRGGTLFLSLKFDALTQADLLTVDVTVDAGPTKTLSQTLAHASGGSVELTFPAGYVVGSTVTIRATLSQGATILAVRGPVSVTLAPGCSSLELDFAGATGGAGGNTAGTGGTAPGTGGAGGKVGAGGNGGTSVGGAAGGNTASGGAAGTTASGGAMVGGATASGGKGGAGGAAAGGHGNGGSVGGASGAGGSVGGAGGGACRALSDTENCYNGVDDNCDGKVDCEDTACTPVAQCVALDPASGAVGESIDPAAKCPADAPNGQTLQNGVTAADCTGCSCGAGTSTLVCSADIYGYGALDLTCGNNAGGTLAATINSTQTCSAPWAGQSVTGMRASAFRGVPAGACVPMGTPNKGPPVWSTSIKFCGVAAVGGGCRAGSSCVPRTVATVGACVLLAGTQKCPTMTTNSSAWYTGLSDTRACGACQCGAPTGGDCNSLIIRADSSATCDGNTLGYLRAGDKLCNLSVTGVPSPGLQFSGSAQPVSCAASTTTSGSLTATGPQTLCCL